MHVHADPDVRARCIDQLTLTRQCKQNGYRGIMYKCHDFITNDIAYLLRATVPGIEVFGGIALNRNYGDTVSVQAAKMATQVTGHYCRCISGCRPTSRRSTCGRRAAACRARRAGKVLPEVVKVMEICADADIIFATGHSSPDECVVLTAKAKEVGVRRRSSRTRARPVEAVDGSGQGLYRQRRVSGTQRAAALQGPSCGDSGVPRTAAGHDGGIRLVHRPRPDRQFISTDLGQALNPNPVDGMHVHHRAAQGRGEGRRAERRYPEDPAMLLGLD